MTILTQALKGVLTWFFFMVTLLLPMKARTQCNPEADSLVLVEFYYATNGNFWTINSNWLDPIAPISQWEGVTVNEEGCVTELNLVYNTMQGLIPEGLGNLSELRVLNLEHNQLTGTIPASIWELPQLTELSLCGNLLTGQIPEAIAGLTSLTHLCLGENQFNGMLPDGLGTLSELVYLNLAKNGFQGEIPQAIWNFENLMDLLLSDNELTGTIPEDLSSIMNLKSLDLSINNMTGDIPAGIWELTNLEFLLLGENDFTGTIPASVGNLTHLRQLNLGYNLLTGEIPVEIGNLSNIKVLDLKGNELTGIIPPVIGSLNTLQRLDLSANPLTGTLPPELGNLELLHELNIYNNHLYGPIPVELANLSNLSELRISHNSFSGTIPPELGNLTNLSVLFLSYNNLTGSIPTELGNLSNLSQLFLTNNDLTGSIPPELGNLTQLQYLLLNTNHLTGNIPVELCSLEYLSQLQIGNNLLSGPLPPELANMPNLFLLVLANNQFTGCFPPEYEVFCAPGRSLNIIGNPGLPGGGDFEAFCTLGAGNCDYSITGHVIYDENQNCLGEPSEILLQNRMVKAGAPNGDYFGWTDVDGRYEIYPAPGAYGVEVLPGGPYWQESCTGVAPVFITGEVQLETIDFFPEALIDCPYLTVDISSPFVRRCFNNTSVVNYCNTGTLVAADAYVEVTFDDLVTIDSASINITSQVGNNVTFNLGDVGVNECGSFYIYYTLSCDAVLDQTICAEAHIFPDSLCQEIAPSWSGATVEVSGSCEGDEARFTIKNTGTGDMLMDETFIVIEDGIILFSEPEPFSLPSGEDFQISFEANGSTYICKATQVDNHPVSFMPSAFIEACGTNEEGAFSTGYATQFPEDDHAPFLSIDCQEVIGSYDPNDKHGYPKGVGEQHFIERGQDIEYHIRFQNTGTDTAFTVVVEDVLAPELDISSLRMGSSSHPYSLEIHGIDTLRFTFNNILLPDSSANEPGSHGFLKFRISQKPDLPLGTVIENTAAIFFDFNEVVITNTVTHTLGENYLEVVAVPEPMIPGLKVTVAPNPVSESTIFEFSGLDFQKGEIFIYNSLGILVRKESFDAQYFTLVRGGLEEGVYLYEVIIDGRKGFTGKLLAH